MMSKFTIPLIALTLMANAYASTPHSELVVHEWGTFTSLQGSDGKPLLGLHHEEAAPLPEFVHSRAKLLLEQEGSTQIPRRALFSLAESAGGPIPSPKSSASPTPVVTHHPSWPDHPCTHCKGIDWNIASSDSLAVNQKMETPVLYFYSPSAKTERVHVEVGFPGGVITQWYPQASSFSPAIGQVSQPRDGRIAWNVDVSPFALDIPRVDSNSIWAPSREVPSANFVSVGGENEKLVFYRGLGRFDTPFAVGSNANEDLKIRIHDALPVPSAFILQVGRDSGSVTPLGLIGKERTISSTLLARARALPMNEYVNQASYELASALEASGLYHDEALAMVNTWKTSYFRAPGIRILYILPRAWTERLLPISLNPSPRKLVRTLVGRVEVFTQPEEQQLLARLSAARGNPALTHDLLADLGRFAEPKLRRAAQLLAEGPVSPDLRDYVESLIRLAAQSDTLDDSAER